MNKNEKLIVFLLGAILVAFLAWRFFSAQTVAPATQTPAKKEAVASQPQADKTPPVMTEGADKTTATAADEKTPTEEQAKASAAEASTQPKAPAPIPVDYKTIENDDIAITLTSNGAAISKTVLKKFPAEDKENSKPVELLLGDTLGIRFAAAPTESLQYKVTQVDKQKVVYTTTLKNGVLMERTITLDKTGYKVNVKDKFFNPTANRCVVGAYKLSSGIMKASIADLTVGSYDCEEEEVIVRVATGSGCGCSCSETMEEAPEGLQKWIAISNHYFMAMVVPQDAKRAIFKHMPPVQNSTNGQSLAMGFLAYDEHGLEPKATYETSLSVYVGPKVYDNLVEFGEKATAATDAEDMMDFGMFGWFSKLLLKGMNFFYSLIPNYGVAIILLTILIRIIFWPLTRKSTLAMRKMAAIQPELKALQQKFKGNPQKIQQETFMLYRKHQVNPLASCFPMLIQIPIFIAFFTMLRSVAELRYADFLWISDLSQPENLFAGYLPIAINILPILTAVTMALQTHLSPSGGDPAQKKMMTWMMPIMMLFFFYHMSSALCLYWTVSQVLSIAQMLWMRRTTPTTDSDVITVK